MKAMIDRMSIQKRMMLYFSVPLLLIQIIVAAFTYPVLQEKFKSQLDYSMGQSINQAVSFLESYVQNMEYLTQLVEKNGEIYGILSAERSFEGHGEDMASYIEYYVLNSIFHSIEFSNSFYRFGLYIPYDISYVNNNYYFFAVAEFITRS